MLDFAQRVLDPVEIIETTHVTDGAYTTHSGAVYLVYTDEHGVSVHRSQSDDGSWTRQYDSLCLAVDARGLQYLVGANLDEMHGYGKGSWFHSTPIADPV